MSDTLLLDSDNRDTQDIAGTTSYTNSSASNFFVVGRNILNCSGWTKNNAPMAIMELKWIQFKKTAATATIFNNPYFIVNIQATNAANKWQIGSNNTQVMNALFVVPVEYKDSNNVFYTFSGNMVTTAPFQLDSEIHVQVTDPSGADIFAVTQSTAVSAETERMNLLIQFRLLPP